MGYSVFNMDHVNEVTKMKDHVAAKQRAHQILAGSTANAKNREKIKYMINSSRNTQHLARGMSNHILAHPAEGLKVVKSEQDQLEQLAQLIHDEPSLEKFIQFTGLHGQDKPKHAGARAAAEHNDAGKAAQFNIPKEHLPEPNESKEAHSKRVVGALKQKFPDVAHEKHAGAAARAWKHIHGDD